MAITKKLIGKFDKHGSSIGAKTSFPVPTVDYNNKVDGFMLIEKDKNVANTYEIKKCFCADCNKSFDVNRTIEGFPFVYGEEPKGVTELRGVKTSDMQDIECPECHKEMQKFAFVEPEEPNPGVENTAENTSGINKTGAWNIPERQTGRYLFEYRDENGKLKRFDDNVMTRSTIVYPSGKQFSYSTEHSQVTDLDKHTMKYITTDITGDTRTTRSTKNPYNPFEHAGSNFMREIRHFSSATATINSDTHDRRDLKAQYVPVYAARHQWDDREDSTCMQVSSDIRPMSVIQDDNGTDVDSYDAFGNYMQDVKAKLLEEQFHDIKSPIMADSAFTGLYLKSHHKDSNEQNTSTDHQTKSKYMFLMANYPVAFEYAAERAEVDVMNYEYSQKRKAAADSTYQAKTMTDKAKAKMLRNELNYVAEQLCSVDNKILKTIHDSKNVGDMYARLRTFAFGDAAEYKKDMSSTKMRIDVENASNESVRDTNKLKSKFNMNPIGVANTIYTCHKLGFKDINYINQMLQIADESPDVNPEPKRIHGRYVSQHPEELRNINANTIYPIETTKELRFMKLYSKTHNPSDVMEIYKDEKTFSLYSECADMYDTVVSCGEIISENAGSNAVLRHEMLKNNIKSYLQSHSVEDAYINYVMKFGKSTPEKINGFISEIKADTRMPEIKAYSDEHGVDAAAEQYKDVLKDLDDPKKYIESYDPDIVDKLSKGKQLLTTKNEKPLFNRSLHEIHEELSDMNKHCVTENRDLTNVYPDDVKAMQKEYQAPDGSGTWNFKVHKDAFDVVKSSTELHNCLGKSYVDKMENHRSYVLYMENELKQRCAAIEIAPNSYTSDDDCKYTVLQFQSDHDTSLDKRYASVALKWMKDSGIDYSRNNDVKKFGSGEAIYGDGTADFHYEEIDDVEGVIGNTQEIQRRQEERLNMAKEIYHYDETTGYDFGVETPDYKPF